VSELYRALAAFAAAPGPGLARAAEALELAVPSAAEHHEVFDVELHPYASVYLGAEGMLGGDARDRVAGFWRALGAVPPAEPDHLAALLGTLATLAEDRAPQAVAARRALLWEHLLSWLPLWLDRLETLAPAALAPWGRLLAEALAAEAESSGPPSSPPAALRQAPALDEEDLVRGLLTPIRSGFILTRHDLARAALELGLGVRLGDRALALQSLLVQDAPAVLARLAGHAAATAERLRQSPLAFRPVSAWWAERAEATAGRLRGLESEAKEVARAR
jgi:nitrate reductase delta subunit